MDYANESYSYFIGTQDIPIIGQGIHSLEAICRIVMVNYQNSYVEPGQKRTST